MKTLKYLPPLAVVTAAVLWSFDGLLRQNLASVSSFLVILLEHIIGAILFIPFLIKGWAEIKNLSQRVWISVMWVAVFGGIIGTFFYTKALSYIGFIDLSVVVLLQKFQPLFAIALAAVILREPLTRQYLTYAAIAVVGGYLVTFGNGMPTFSANDATLIASLMALCAAFAWGSSTVLGKHALGHLSFFTLTSLRLWVTSIVAGAIFFALPDRPDPTALSGNEWLFILAIVLSTGSVALFIYYYGLKHIPATHATIYELFWPLSAVLIDWLIRGRLLAPSQMIGGILLVAASVLLSQNSKNS